ncbi:hypothetical protein BC939DRAFT_437182 [Gamsiella multidivaricata]|uniref:uncharacterized protein n=1 Tax=Gamsiella multidivaricata TaxID=101098 RepID=UPI0022207F6F|nr:uncharacterized protein BC939DRAFT_437182 [Gamsiella multidivaricata]KAG0366222.1 hypothetical protein BGZ54_005656 [Gamsiella multidivaricata]KAI7831476.1 hypothetical protein BC939DRAFT_437182 [Gamsiella multidivaricata]
MDTGPKIIIVGAGLGGLTMALLLERAGIDYVVLERSHKIRPLGSATGLGFNIMPLCEQLGIWEDMKKISKTIELTTVFRDDMDVIREVKLKDNKALTGYDSLIMPRIDLHALLLSRVPAEKVLMGKKVLSVLQNEHGVMVRTSDGMTHDADILIGADGAYSGVRQSLYKQLERVGQLPRSDSEQLKVCHTSFLGTTAPLDPEKFPGLKDHFSHCDTIIGTDRPETWRYFTVPDNRVCWRIDVQLESTVFEDNDTFRNSEYGPESCEMIPEEWRSFRLPINGTMGDLIDATPKERVSKVMLEEKIFTTWYYSRTVLIGDACHKMLPNFGRGALNAMMDAVSLANALYEMPSCSMKHLSAAFEEYYKERFPTMTSELAASQQMSKVMAGQSRLDSVTRHVMLKYVPNWFQQKNVEYEATVRPQANFIPRVSNRGTLPVKPQKESKKYAALVATRGAKEI